MIAVVGGAASASAQTKEQPKPKAAARPAPPRQSKSIEIGGFAMLGDMNLWSTQSFDTIVGTHRGPIAGGGARVGLPWFGLFAEVGAWRMHEQGERVFMSNGTRVPLGIHEDITLTPIEFSGGWRMRFRKMPKLIPYVAGGYTSMRYQETSDFSATDEDIDQNFGGYHVFGGAEYKVWRWLGVAGEAQWTTVPNAIGEGGVSALFGEDNLGGRSLRFKITIGR
jgi:hypothetical protein